MKAGALGVLADVLGLRRVVAAEGSLLTGDTFLVALAALLAVGLTVIAIGAASLWVGGVVGGILAGRGAECATRLLSLLGLLAWEAVQTVGSRRSIGLLREGIDRLLGER